MNGIDGTTERKVPLLRQVTHRVNAVVGINLGQGTCQLPVPPSVLEAAFEGMKLGHNRYTLAEGAIDARQAIARKLQRHNGISADPANEILITAGVTGAFEAICSAVLKPGDEVVGFEPYYPYHHNALCRYGAATTYVRLEAPDWRFALDDLEKALSRKPKFLLINTPANPTGKVFTESELREIGKLAQKYDTLVVTDEMYEYMLYDSAKHISPASLPEFCGRTVTMGGYSKTFSVTGWRIGYAVAPVRLAKEMVKALDELYICAPSPAQAAIARAVESLPESFYADLKSKYARKREIICSALEQAGFEISRPQGAYYVLADFSKTFGDTESTEFVYRMIDLVKVGAVPSGDFVRDSRDQHWIRFCFAVEDEVLEAAGKQLKLLSHLWPNVGVEAAA